MKTLYIKFKVVGISYFDEPPDETLSLNGLDTGMRCHAALGPSSPAAPSPYAEYEIVHATFSANALMQPTLYAFTDDNGVTYTASDDVWLSRPVPDMFALPDIRTAHLRREFHEAALERLSREI